MRLVKILPILYYVFHSNANFIVSKIKTKHLLHSHYQNTYLRLLFHLETIVRIINFVI